MTRTPASTPISVASLLENFSAELKLLQGNIEFVLSGLGHPDSASPSELIVISDEDHLEKARASKSQAWIIPTKLAEKASDSKTVTLLQSDSPKLAMAKIAKAYFRPSSHFVSFGVDRIAKTAQIDASVQMGKNVIVGPGAVVGRNSVLGDDVVIGANSVIEEGCHIGARTHIHPQVFLGHHCTLGQDCEIKPQAVIGGEGFGYATDLKRGEHHRITHFGKVRIGNFVHIGSGTQVDRGTFLDSTIGDHVKIDNLCHFGHNIEIGRGTIVTGGVIVAGSTKIGQYCVIGGRTTITGHIEIADQVQVGGLSAVSKSLLEPGQYGGHPIQPLKEYLRTQSSLRAIPSLRKSVSKILKTLNLKEDQ